MNLLWTAIVGLIAGALAKLIMPGKDGGNIWVTMALGVGGAVVANIVGNALGWYAGGGSAGIIGSTIGAVALLALYRMFMGAKAKTA